MNSFTEKLLQIYCRMNHVTVEDIKSSSRERGLPTHRHIFAYCMRKHYSMKYWIIGKALNRTQVRYGIKQIQELLDFFENKEDRPNVLIIRKRIKAFLEVCHKHKRPDELNNTKNTLDLSNDLTQLEVLEELQEYKGFDSLDDFLEYIGTPNYNEKDF